MLELLFFVLKDFFICLEHFLLQLEDGAVDLFSNTIKDDGLLIDMEVLEKPRTLDIYLQGWHNQIWDQGFPSFFKRKDNYSKSKAFQDQRHTDLAVKRAVFR